MFTIYLVPIKQPLTQCHTIFEVVNPFPQTNELVIAVNHGMYRGNSGILQMVIETCTYPLDIKEGAHSVGRRF